MNVMLTVLCLSLGFHNLPQIVGSSGSASSSSTCVQDLLSKMTTLDDLEKVVYSIANDKGVTPTVILNRLLRKIRTKQRMEKLKNKNQLQEMALQELMSTMVQFPPQPKAPRNEEILVHLPPSSDISQVPSIIQKPQIPFDPRPASAPHPSSYPPEDSSRMFISVPAFRPPPGVTVRVNLGGSEAPLPDVTVTLSPMMTVVEALRQAEAKFRSTLGLSPSYENVITFSRSPHAGCYVISRFDTVRSTDHSAWRITVSDRSGRTVYDGVCLPTKTEAPVKPGTTISLSYTVF